MARVAPDYCAAGQAASELLLPRRRCWAPKQKTATINFGVAGWLLPAVRVHPEVLSMRRLYIAVQWR